MKTYILIFLQLVLLGCNSGSPKKSVVISNSGILFNIDDYKKHIVDTAIIDHVKYLPLELTENSMIGKIDKLIIRDSLIYILDKRISKAVYIFDLSGRFVNKVGIFGKGRGELYYLNDIDLDKEGNLYLLDIGSAKILKYDFLGEYIGEKRFGFFTHQFAHIDPNHFAFNQGGRENDQISDLNYNLLTWNNEIKGRFFSYNEDSKRFPPMRPYDIYKSDNMTLYNKSFTYDIYEIFIDSLSLKYSFDFGRYSLPNEYFEQNKEKDAKQFGIDLIKSDYVWSVGSIYENDEIFVSIFRINSVPIYFIYSKKRHQFVLRKIENIINEEGILGGIIPKAIYGEYLAGVININEVNSVSKKLINQLDNDNPVIVLYKVKTF